MKAVRLHEYHKRPSVDDVPEPKVSGPLDVLVRIGAAPGCAAPTCTSTKANGHRSRIRSCRSPSGMRTPAGSRRSARRWSTSPPGDTVILHPLVTCGQCRACRDGDDMHCANGIFPGVDGTDGGMAEYLLTGARNCVKLDPSLQPADIAALADAGLTAYHAVKSRPPAVPGDQGSWSWVPVASGTSACRPSRRLRRPRSSWSIATRRPSTWSGAWAPITRSPGGGSLKDNVLELTDGQGAEVVFDFVGEQGAETVNWDLTKRAGSHYIIGYGGTVQVPTIHIISTERNIVGNLVGTYNDLAELMALTAQGKVQLHTRTYPLDAVNDAMDDLDAGRLQGRGILVPG